MRYGLTVDSDTVILTHNLLSLRLREISGVGCVMYQLQLAPFIWVQDWNKLAVHKCSLESIVMGMPT